MTRDRYVPETRPTFAFNVVEVEVVVDDDDEDDDDDDDDVTVVQVRSGCDKRTKLSTNDIDNNNKIGSRNSEQHTIPKEFGAVIVIIVVFVIRRRVCSVSVIPSLFRRLFCVRRFDERKIMSHTPYALCIRRKVLRT